MKVHMFDTCMRCTVSISFSSTSSLSSCLLEDTHTHTHTSGRAHDRRSHAPHMNDSGATYECVMCHMCVCVMAQSYVYHAVINLYDDPFRDVAG